MSVMMRVDDETHKAIKALAERDGRSITKELAYLVKLAQQYEENRKKEDYIKNLAMQSFLEADRQLERKKTEQSMDKFMKRLQKQQASAPVLTNEQMGITANNYPPDTYEWYMEEALTRELTNEETMRANELSLIKNGWDPEAAHKKIYC